MASINPNKERFNSKHAQEATADLLHEGQKLAQDLRDQGVDKLQTAKKEVSHYSDELLELVREHPLKSVLIADGVGFLLSVLLKK